MSGTLVILGGAGGIGRALVPAASAAGFSPVVLDLAASLEAHPASVASYVLDARDPDSVDAAAEALGDGPIAGLVVLSGYMGAEADVIDTDPAVWTDVLGGNLSMAFHAARSFAPRIAPGGSLVLCGSGLGHRPRKGYGPYAVAKAAIAGLTRQLALELAPAARVNAVSPSAVDTAFLRGGTGRSDESAPLRFDAAAYAAAIPLERIAEPEDVVGPILFLLSPASGYMTGQVLHVNGGSYMP